jgi:hypothetical protein
MKTLLIPTIALSLTLTGLTAQATETLEEEAAKPITTERPAALDQASEKHEQHAKRSCRECCEACAREAREAEPEDLGPEREVGWTHSKRLPIYANLMLLGEALGEDKNYRLTTNTNRSLGGFGGMLRVGAVLNPNTKIGVRMQSFFRPTKKVILDPAPATTPAPAWGAVQMGYIGPEFIHVFDSGLYLAGSIGVAGLASVDRLGCGNDGLGSCNEGESHGDVQRGTVGGAGLASVGYEWRAGKWFALNAELFAGVYRGLNDNEDTMTSSLVGFGLGIGL